MSYSLLLIVEAQKRSCFVVVNCLDKLLRIKNPQYSTAVLTNSRLTSLFLVQFLRGLIRQLADHGILELKMKSLLTRSKKKDFSSLLLTGFLLLSLAALVIAIGQRQLLFGRADVGTFPQRIKITNLSENSFSVSWVTDKAVKATVQYQLTDQTPKIAFPPDQSSQQTHHVTVTNLLPATEYSFYLLSGGETFDNQGEPFRVITCSLTQEVPSVPFLVYGRVENNQRRPVSQAIVYFGTDQSAPISTTTNKEGHFILALNNSWTLDKKKRFQPRSGMKGELLVEAGSEDQAKKELIIRPDLDLGELVLDTGEAGIEAKELIARPVEMSFWQRIKQIFQF